MQVVITRNDQLSLKANASTDEAVKASKGRGRSRGRGRGGRGLAAAKSSSSKGGEVEAPAGDDWAGEEGWTQEDWATWTGGEHWTEEEWATWTDGERWTEEEWAAWAGDEDWTEQATGDDGAAKKKGKRGRAKKANSAPQPEPAVEAAGKAKAKAKAKAVARANGRVAPIPDAGNDDFEYPQTFARRSCAPIPGSQAALVWRGITRSFWEEILPFLARGERTVAEAGFFSGGSTIEVLWYVPAKCPLVKYSRGIVRPPTGRTLGSAGCTVGYSQVMMAFPKS